MTEQRETAPDPYFIGVDLGQARDWTAIVVAEQMPRAGLLPLYQIGHLERWHPRRYQDVVRRVAEIVEDLRVPVHVFDGYRGYDTMRALVSLTIDRTGVGRAVGDLFSDADLPVDLQLVSITGGNAVTRVDNTAGVPKRDLAGTVAVLLQNKRLEYLTDSPMTDMLKAELQNFRAKINYRGHDTYEAGTPGDDWREAEHDDLVLAAALALWQAEQQAGGEFQALPAATIAALADWFGVGG